MTKDEALRLALEALENITSVSICEATHHAKKDRHLLCEECPNEVRHLKAITAIKTALEAKDEIDWKDMYEKEKRHSEMWVAKYEKDIGPLEKAVPHQKAKDKPVRDCNRVECLGSKGCIDLCWKKNAIPPQRKPLDEKELEKLWDEATDHMEHFCSQYWDFARAIEAAHGIKGEA